MRLTRPIRGSLRPGRLLSKIALFLIIFSLRAFLVQAQDGPGEEQGVFPSRTYHGTDFESVNVGSGRVVVHIPLLEDHSQRGALNFTYSLSLSSSGNWSDWLPTKPCCYVWKLPLSQTGMSLIADQVPIGVVSSTYHDPDTGKSDNAAYVQEANGAKHPLSGAGSGLTSGETIDGSGFQTSVDPLGRSTITNREGISFHTAAPELIEDANGNQMSYGSPTTDTLGRTWTRTPSADVSGCPVAAQSSVLWTVPAPSGTTRTFKLCYSTIAIQTNFGLAGVNELTTNLSFMTGVVLPNLTTYRFDYDSYGDIAQITLPTGGYVSYVWQNTNPICSIYALKARVLSSRTVHDGSHSYTWNYSWSWGGSSIVTDPFGNDTTYASSNCQDVSLATYYTGSHTNGTVIKTVAKTYLTISDPYIFEVYNGEGYPPTLLQSTTTTWSNGQVSQVAQNYDPGFTWSDSANIDWSTGKSDSTPQQGYYGLVTQENYHDYGNGSPGPLLSTTNTSYLALSNSSYLNANLLDLKASVVVLNPSGYKCAETDYAYDDSTRLFTSNVTEQHGAAPNSVRGNLSSTTQQLTSTPCQSNASWIPVVSYHNAYDTGMTYQTIDPLGHTTTYGYSPTYYGAYPTTITNALSQSTTYVPDFNTGLDTSVTDPNSLTTSYGYDNMLRMTQAVHPDGGAVNIAYQESSYPFTTTTSGTALNRTDVTVFDGLGRPTQTQLTTDPQGTVYTDTTYDALGRVSTVSNPHRTCVSDITSSCGATTYGYDALSRKTSETYPDNSVLKTVYCGGAWTLVIDPTTRWRRSRVDGMGRLVEVDEPNATMPPINPTTGCPGTNDPVWITSYTLDPLGNLTNVLQNGSHARTFTYDSLSRLLTSTNPEVGTITYSYYSDGTVQTKKDARNITTSYTYDGIHRELTRTYSNSDPTVTTVYDQSACLGLTACQNIGHRTSVTDAAGSESWAYQVDKTHSRSIHVNQRTTNAISKTSTYYFDLAKNITQFIYPTGRIVNYTFDAADRPVKAVDSSNGITYATGFQTSPGSTCIVNVTCYTPQGNIYTVSLGQTTTFTGLNITDAYNTRLQPGEFKASSTGGNAIDISYNYMDPVNSGNAGHVWSIANNLYSGRTQSFNYDQVNRIISAGTSATTGPICWGYQYVYDNGNGTTAAWGNLTSQPAWSPIYNACTQPTMPVSTSDGNNHLSSLAYDAEGNATSDGAFSYVWDAESQLKSASTTNYLYDSDGRRAAKVGSKLYWYGSGGEILAETNASGSTLNEYIFFGGKRVAMLTSGGTAQFYVEDSLGSSRIVTTNTGIVCYDADFAPFGAENAITNSCTQNVYKFEGKERDAETSTLPGDANGNDYFGARYYSNRYGRWLSADWSNVPVPVPYANLTNPQTLNLYAMVADDPESFADLDGHDGWDFLAQTIGGIENAINENNGINTGSYQPSENALGRAIGNAISVVQGGVEVLGGAAAVVTGGTEALAASPTVVGSAPGVALAGVGVVGVVHGATVLKNAISNKSSTTENSSSGPKAADAAGESAGGQATNEHGEKLGPSGKPMVHEADMSSKKGAKDAARNAGQAKPVQHPSPRQGKPHFHPSDAKGKKKPGSTHYNYPD